MNADLSSPGWVRLSICADLECVRPPAQLDDDDDDDERDPVRGLAMLTDVTARAAPSTIAPLAMLAAPRRGLVAHVVIVVLAPGPRRPASASAGSRRRRRAERNIIPRACPRPAAKG